MIEGRYQRIWVSEDRCTLLTIWYDIELLALDSDTTVVTVARRDHPSHTWGPPITLTEEKT